METRMIAAGRKPASKCSTKRYGCEIIADKVDFLTKGRGTGEGAPDIDED